MALDLYIPVFIQIILATLIAVGILAASHLFGQKAKKHFIKDSPYECGMIADDNPHPRFSVKFYTAAMLFVLFDIEVVFLVPFALIYRDFLAAHISIVIPILFFISVLTLGLVYELRKKALDWN